MNCKTCQNVLPDLLLEPQPPSSKSARAYEEARAHLAACSACAREFNELQAMFALLDTWEAPEISPYFDQKLAVRLREEQAAPPAGFFERIRDRLQFSTGRQLRPAAAGMLALALLIGGGSIGIATLVHNDSARSSSATVNDLQILDRNVQAFQQVDQILQEDGSDDAPPPQS